MLVYDPVHTLLSNGTLNTELKLFISKCGLPWKKLAPLGAAAWEFPGYCRQGLLARVRRVLSERQLEKMRVAGSLHLRLWRFIHCFAISRSSTLSAQIAATWFSKACGGDALWRITFSPQSTRP